MVVYTGDFRQYEKGIVHVFLLRILVHSQSLDFIMSIAGIYEM